MKSSALVSILLLLAACGKATETGNSVTKEPAPKAPAAPAAPQAPTTTVAASTAPAPSPKDRKVLIEPKGPIDPKSVEAAGQVVQHYGALIEQGRWTASRDYWGDANSAKAFERNFRDDADVHIEIGDLGEPEGAAGSIFVTEPVTFYGKTNAGGTYRRPAEVTLRRVNDVDGSSEAQRRWHIERIEWKGGAG